MPSHRDTARQFPWDRTPSFAGLLADASVAGIAGSIVILTYTCPAGRKAAIDAVALSLLVTTAGAAADRVSLYCMVLAGGPTALIGVLSMNSGTLYTRDHAEIGEGGWVLAGQTVRIDMASNLVGVVCRVICGMKLTECQA